MSHGLLTLFNRSMRVDLRGWKGHGFRIAFAAFIYFALISAHMSALSFGAPGLRFFTMISFLNLFFIMLAGCSFFATAITEEKEEGTLGLLKMAGMNRAAILLGKSTSRLCASALLLVIQVPFLLLAITLGGVLYWQVAAAFMTLLTFLIFTANVGLFFSVVCRKSGTAVSFTVMAIIARFALPPLVNVVVSLNPPPPNIAGFVNAFTGWFVETSPFARLRAILATGFAQPLVSPQIIFDCGAGLLLFVASWLLFERFTQSDRSSQPARGFLIRGAKRRPRVLGAGRAWDNPFLWKSFYFMAGGVSLTVVKFVIYGLIALGILLADYWNLIGRNTGANRQIDPEMFSVILAMAMVAAIALELASAASRLFHDEWKYRTLENLLLLPVSVGRIARSQAAGAVLGLIPALCYIALAALVSKDVGEVVIKALFTPAGWASILGVVVFLHIVVLVSLFVKWGALPLACVISIVLTYAMMPVMALAGALAAGFESVQVGAVPICGLFIGLCAGLEFVIAKRLEVLGGR